MNDALRILDMETKLADDESGAYRDQLCEALRGDLAEVKRHIDRGLPPEEFQQASHVVGAIEASISVVERVWKSTSGR